ncbi:chitin synthase-domain-containing protein [Chytriomyces sp. MP71]|nr:chitin synthase-domain-containing protein [Chytriomyces sp. MP71]
MSSRPNVVATDDISKLANLHQKEAAARLLETRAATGITVTRVGAAALVVLNARERNPIANDSVVAWAESAAPNKDPLAPSVNALAASVFFHMLREQHDQSVLFLGESGSGKSESRRAFVNQICALSKSAKKKSKVISGVLKTETLLDAFCHAATIDNPNSSRFGRYSELQFDERGKLIGSKLLTYLLEKSRVVNTVHDDGRNFNVFYWLLAGATPDEKAAFRLQDLAHFSYVSAPAKSKSNNPVKPTAQDALHLQTLREHMKSVGIGKRQQYAIFQALAAILHLGSISFVDDPSKPNDACEVKNHDGLAHAASLLGVDARNLEYALTYKTKVIRKELCTIYLNAADAQKQRDALSMTLYTLILEWIVEHLNERLDCSDKGAATFIGTVDLSGFQDYKVNKFEQLLYNFSNEKLHAYAKKRVFEEYSSEAYSEGINVARTPDYPKSKDSLALFVGNSEASIIPLIEEESNRTTAKQSDTHLIEVFNEKLASNPCYVASSATASNSKAGSKASATMFSVRHYAGLVEYDAAGLVERNTDATIVIDFISLFKGNGYDIHPSENPFVRSLFSGQGVENGPTATPGAVASGIPAHLHMSPMRRPSLKKKVDSVLGKSGPKDGQNISAALEASLNELIETLEDTVSWTVYCVKPNEDLADDEFDIRTVNGQLQHMCVTQHAQSRAYGDYTASMTFDDFKTRYRLIVEPLGLDMSRGGKLLCRDYVTAASKSAKEFNVGNTRVFMSEFGFRAIEDELRIIEKAIQDEVKSQRKVASSRGNTSRYDDDGGSVQGSSHYDDGASYADEVESHFESEFQFTNQTQSNKGDLEMGHLSSRGMSTNPTVPLLSTAASTAMVDRKDDPEIEEKKKMSPQRCRWVALTWCLTWWIPSPCLSLCGLKRPDIRMAWREKVALCIIIAFMCGVLLFFIIGFGMIICPRQNVYSAFELQSYTDVNNPFVYAYGRVYKIPAILDNHFNAYGVQKYQWSNGLLGGDVSSYFYKNQNFGHYCPGLTTPNSTWDNLSQRATVFYPHNATSDDGSPRQYLEYMNQYAIARVAWPISYVQQKATETNKLLVIYNNVYDVSSYFNGASQNFLNDNMKTLFGSFWGKDATQAFKKVIETEGKDQAAKYLNCMNNMFYIGTVDHRADLNCQVSNGILLTATIILCLVIIVKFISALQFGTPKDPEEHDKFVICQIPCYTEDAESLTNTLESIALLRYDDKRKLIFVVADGMIIGSGNDRPTPRIVLDILGVDPLVDPDLLSFESLGEGDKQHNMGKVYSGLYEIQGHNVPFIVVVKTGKPSERSRPGNRGKRDSQMILMRFLNRVHFNAEMNPLELELYHHMKNIIGVNPSFYEYVLMVDADTEVFPDSLNRMVSAMIHDSRIMGICGETLISNDKESFFTMIQVYEYFISHHLSKAFESLFGSVTCLPGCFCMYRIRTPTKNIPLLIAPAVIDGYSENNVNTLHLKNLLHLGEDRYLTTLMMKHFPKYKLTFTADAQCKTNVPDRWPVLLSQRRRWINSTIHNLVELLMLPQLCGFCCFSMRFVVFLDLFSTVVQPAAIIYIGYLVYLVSATNEQFPLISVIMIGAIYGLQVIIFLIKREWAQIAWMLLYILAMPVFSFYIPLYAFWHFDDFSWGNTRVVVGDKGKKLLAADVVPFDPASIPRRRWAEFEKEAFEKNSNPSEYAGGATSVYSETGMTSRQRSGTGVVSTQMTQMTYQQGFAAPGSVYGSTYGASNLGASVPVSPFSYPSGYAPVAGAQPAVPFGQQMPPGYFPGYAESVTGSQRMSVRGATPVPMVALAPGAEPTDEQLLNEIRRILATADLMTVTKKQVRDELSALFRMDMTPRKAVINQFIEEILQGRL